MNVLRSPHLCAAAVCVGIAAANLARLPRAAIALAVAVALVAAATDASRRALVLATALALTGWWWGSARLDALDHSVLLARVGTAERSHLVVTGPARLSSFQMRLPAEVTRFGLLRFHEPVLLELPLGRAPPQGALLEAITTVRLPRPASHGFDERAWLRHQGIHVVLRADRWTLAGHRGGLWGVADRLRAALARSTARGCTASAAESSKASSSATSRRSRPTCGTAFAPRASTTSSRFPARTSRWSRQGRWCSHG